MMIENWLKYFPKNYEDFHGDEMNVICTVCCERFGEHCGDECPEPHTTIFKAPEL
jgi:hypothetical protein